jgi:hypothetical protein
VASVSESLIRATYSLAFFALRVLCYVNGGVLAPSAQDVEIKMVLSGLDSSEVPPESDSPVFRGDIAAVCDLVISGVCLDRVLSIWSDFRGLRGNDPPRVAGVEVDCPPGGGYAFDGDDAGDGGFVKRGVDARLAISAPSDRGEGQDYRHEEKVGATSSDDHGYHPKKNSIGRKLRLTADCLC